MAVVTARTPLPDERADSLLTDERRVARERLRDLLLASAGCIASMLAGLFLLGWSIHTTDLGWGRIAFWGGLLVGNGGIFVTVYWLYHRTQARGDQ